jgi:predicted Rossmann fold flavoprotein
MIHRFDALIVGGGAAGLMCAIEAGKRGRRVAVLDHANRLGKKILISGGGRCNFTNLYCGPEDFISSNPHFAKSALARYTPADFISLVEKHGIPYHEKTLGQLFCDRSAHDIVDTKIEQVARTNEFVLRAARAEFRAPVLVVATGGLSIPKLGASSLGYDLARQFGLALREPRPALVPLTLREDDRSRYCDLAGVSAEIIASCTGQSFRERMLITHRGLSGPAILQISSYWKSPEAILIDLAPGQEITGAFHDSTVSRSQSSVRAELAKFLPRRLSDRWLDFHSPTAFSNAALSDLEDRIHAWAVIPSGTEGFEKAEVTAGGIDTDELSAKTMESRKVSGLYLIGELVDVTGHLGGFNFQWAWASGAAAGRAV